MLSRLVILTLVREVLEYLEAKSVGDWIVKSYQSQFLDVAFTKCDTVQETRVLEDRLAVIMRACLKELDKRP